MRLIRFLTLIAMQLVLLGLALHALLGHWGFYQTHVAGHVPELLRPTGALLARSYWVCAALLPVLYWAVNLAIWRKNPKAMRVRTASGETLLLDPGTLIKFIRRRLEDHPAVTSQRVRINQSSAKGMAIHASVNVKPIANLLDLRHELEDDIRHSLSTVVGIEKIDNITIILALDERGTDVRPGQAAQPAAAVAPPVKTALEEPVDDKRIDWQAGEDDPDEASK